MSSLHLNQFITYFLCLISCRHTCSVPFKRIWTIQPHENTVVTSHDVSEHGHRDHHHHHNCFTTLFPGPPGWAGARRKLLDFMVQEKINRGRHTDNPAGHHSIRTNQCPPPPSSHFYRPDALPAIQPTVSKHWRQLGQWYLQLCLAFQTCFQWLVVVLSRFRVRFFI